MRKRPWYEEVFTREYLAQYAHRSDEAAAQEVPFVVKALDLPEGARVFDLCCGAGRHSRALTQHGMSVTGMDLSRDLLEDAQKKSHSKCATGGLPTSARYVRGDMRQLPFQNESFDGVVNLFTSFGYFKTDAQNLDVLKEVARVLKKGAPFVMDYLNIAYTLKTLVKKSERQIGEVLLKEQRWYDEDTQRLKKRTRTISGSESFVRTESVRAYTKLELQKMFRCVGLKIADIYGDLSGSKFNLRSSTRCVLLAHKQSGV